MKKQNLLKINKLERESSIVIYEHLPSLESIPFSWTIPLTSFPTHSSSTLLYLSKIRRSV